ncbi:MAG: DUF2442 domain-containing protein [Bacteroidota bacterium]|nr:DUF2442 domain-containing protein [Bacteroidota bacterium]
MIQKAEYIKDYQIEVYFTDGNTRTIDLFTFLSTSKHPLINKYLNIELFKQFRIEMGTICWGDNEFDLNPMNIYNGRYDADMEMQESKAKSTSHLKIRETSKAPNAETTKSISDARQKKGFKSENVEDLLRQLKS